MWLWVVVLVCASGCTRTSTENAAGKPEPASFDDGSTADDIVQRMLKTYQSVESYVDNAQYHERYVRRDTGLEYNVPPHVVSVVYRRPNRLRLNRQVPEVDSAPLSVAVTANGQQVRAFVSDYTRQVLEYPQPDRSELDTLIATPALREAVLPVPIENLYPQADLLLSSPTRPPRLFNTGIARRLPDDSLRGVPCYRVELRSDGSGARILWIDQQSYLLRRMEMPTEQVRRAMDPEGLLHDLQLWIDLQDATVDITIDDPTFEMDIPSDAIRVRQFVAPPTAPPEILGKSIGQFSLAALEGEAVTHETLADHVTVLDFWFTGCAPCQQSVPALQKLYEKYRETDRFKMYAVSIDRDGVNDRVVESVYGKWGGTTPILRDLQGAAQQNFAVEEYPTTVLVGPDGKIHHFARGAKSNYDDWLAPIDALLAGEDVAEEKLSKFRHELSQFEADLEEVSLDQGPKLKTPEKEPADPPSDDALSASAEEQS